MSNRFIDNANIDVFENTFAKLQDKQYAITACNGTATLHAALEAAKSIRPHAKYVITTPLTMAATSMAIVMAGLIPVWADIAFDTFQMEQFDVDEAMRAHNLYEEDICAIMPVGIYGAENPKFRVSAPVIEDNAQCITVPIHGDIASYSFQSSKILAAGEGGCLVTDNEKFADYMRRYISLGYQAVGARSSRIERHRIQSYDYMRHQIIAPNYRMPQIVAYYLNNQVRTLRDEINMRKQCASKWKESINEFIDAAIMFPQLRIRNHDNWCYTVALVDEKLWNPIYNICSKLGTNFYGAWALTYKELPFQNIGMHNCRNAEKLHDKLIQLPIGGDRTRDIENFHKAVKTVLDTH